MRTGQKLRWFWKLLDIWPTASDMGAKVEDFLMPKVLDILVAAPMEIIMLLGELNPNFTYCFVLQACSKASETVISFMWSRTRAGELILVCSPLPLPHLYRPAQQISLYVHNYSLQEILESSLGKLTQWGTRWQLCIKLYGISKDLRTAFLFIFWLPLHKKHDCRNLFH